MRLICVLLTVFVLGVTPAFAEDDVKLEVEVLTVNDCEMIPHKGKDLCGLTLDEWKRVLQTNRTLEHKNKLLYAEHQKSFLLEQQGILLKQQLEASQANEQLLIVHTKKLTTDIIALDKKYQNERVKFRLGDKWAWTVSAVSASILLGVLADKAFD